MTAHRTRSSLVLLTVALGLLPGCHKRPHPSERAECIITDAETHRVFDRLVPALRPGDCSFEGLTTRQNRMNVVFSTGGTDQPAVVVAHTSCLPNAMPAGTRYVLTTPAQASSRCARSVQALRSTLEAMH